MQPSFLSPEPSFFLFRSNVTASVGVHVVTGQNNSGKTRLLELLAKASFVLESNVESIGGPDFTRKFRQAIREAGQAISELEAAAMGVKITWPRDLRLTPPDPDRIKLQAVHPNKALENLSNRILDNLKIPLVHKLSPRLARRAGRVVTTNRFVASRGNLSEPARPDDLSNAAAHFDYFERNPESEALAARILEAFKQVSGGIELQVRAIPGTPVGRQFLVKGTDSVVRPIDASGDGLRDLFYILLHLHLSKDVDAFIEEPGVRLHPDAQRRLARHFEEASTSRAIYVATHDEAFVSADFVVGKYSVRREGSTSIVDGIADAKATRRELLKLGHLPQEGLLSDAIVLCEGPSDSVLFDELLQTPASAEIRANSVTTAWFGGDGELISLKGVALVETLTKLVPHAAIALVVDKRRKDQSEHKAVLTKLQGAGAAVRYLEVGDLEDYFLEASFIEDSLRHHSNQDVCPLSHQKIQDLLSAPRNSESAFEVLKRIWKEAKLFAPRKEQLAMSAAAYGRSSALVEKLGTELEAAVAMAKQMRDARLAALSNEAQAATE